MIMPAKVALRRKLPNIPVHITRHGCCTGLMFDFICLDDPPPRSEKVDHFIDLATDRCFAAGRRAVVYTSAGPILWDVLVPRADAQSALDVLAAAALGEWAPFDALVAEWSRHPAPTLSERLAARAQARRAKPAAQPISTALGTPATPDTDEPPAFWRELI
jgi:hypothetical protein